MAWIRLICIAVFSTSRWKPCWLMCCSTVFWVKLLRMHGRWSSNNEVTLHPPLNINFTTVHQRFTLHTSPRPFTLLHTSHLFYCTLYMTTFHCTLSCFLTPHFTSTYTALDCTLLHTLLLTTKYNCCPHLRSPSSSCRVLRSTRGPATFSGDCWSHSICSTARFCNGPWIL